MKSDDIEAIIGILIGLFTIGIIMVPVGALWVYIILQNGKRKRIRERILAVHANLVGSKRWFPVRYASQPRFEAMLKILPWDTAGLLIVAPGGVLFLGENLAGDPVTLQFAPGNSRLAWLGKCPWPNGAVSWFQFQTADQKHHFTSETGIMIFGSHSSTRAVFDEANQNFSGGAAGRV